MRIFGVFLALVVASPALADEVIQTYEGSGAHTTRPFTVDGPWEIQWNVSGDVFQIYLYDAEGDMRGVPANQLGAGSGSAYQPQGGSYYLQMNAAGAWSVSIVAID